MTSKKSARGVPDALVRSAIARSLDKRIIASGAIELPCVPRMVDHYVGKLLSIWELLGKKFKEDESAQLRDVVLRGMEAGYRHSPHAILTVEYEARRRYPETGISYRIGTKAVTLTAMFEQWVSERPPPLFGKLPDAKVVDVAASLGDPTAVPVLDVGAGTGRNAIGLAERGHPTTALELVPAFCDEMRKSVTASGIALEILQGDIQASELRLEPARYRLVVMSEVVTHFRHPSEIRRAFERFADAMASGGLVVMNTFLAASGYKPDEIARDAATVAWSGVFTRADLEFITQELPFDRMSDELAYEYERDHLPPEEWPPTGWFAGWAKWLNVVDLPAEQSPVELRWLVYRRR
jgi:SAM-dependent methyltransferase